MSVVHRPREGALRFAKSITDQAPRSEGMPAAGERQVAGRGTYKTGIETFHLLIYLKVGGVQVAHHGLRIGPVYGANSYLAGAA